MLVCEVLTCAHLVRIDVQEAATLVWLNVLFLEVACQPCNFERLEALNISAHSFMRVIEACTRLIGSML